MGDAGHHGQGDALGDWLGMWSVEAGVRWRCWNKVETTRLGHSSAVSAASCTRRVRSRWDGGDKTGRTFGYGMNLIRIKEGEVLIPTRQSFKLCHSVPQAI